MKRLLALLLGLLPAAPLGAHPHVFIDTGLELYFDASGRLESLRITWVYDEFYSLLVTEDMGLDPDFDGKLTAEEQNRLSGFDMKWIAGFNGDLEIYQGDALLPLSGPSETTAQFADGRITTTHLRRLEAATDPTLPYQILPYDLTYYTAYDVTLPVEIAGKAGCAHRIEEPDLDAGLLALRAELQALDPALDPEEAGLPNIGKKLATRVIVSCPVS